MRLTTVIQRSIASIWLTQAFGRETDEYQSFHGTVRGTIGRCSASTGARSIYTLVVATILGLGTSLILGFGGYLVYRDQFVQGTGDAGMTIGKLYVFLSLLGKVLRAAEQDHRQRRDARAGRRCRPGGCSRCSTAIR